ncbi:MAG: mycothiol synthase, partial [Actinomycetota bacterium]|nr:mycothiol synthase [Actinomycetota bacterium]
RANRLLTCGGDQREAVRVPTPHRDELVVTRGALRVHLLKGGSGAKEAIALLAEAESRVEAPLVDEVERRRLHALATGGQVATHWHGLLARSDEATLGYAGVVLPARGGESNAELVVDRSRARRGEAVSALFDAVRQLAEAHVATGLVVWIRHATDEDLARARAAGFGVRRRLLVLGRPLGQMPPEPALPEGVKVRSYRPEVDDDAVVAVLRTAFEGRAESDWDHARLAQRRSFAWFDPTDLLIAQDPRGDVSAVHWTKRRGDGVGEVYVLAVTPAAQGIGLGRALLRAGLRHLWERGCHDVLLWVDEDNLAAINLYRSEGFTTRWVDVAFDAEL